MIKKIKQNKKKIGLLILVAIIVFLFSANTSLADDNVLNTDSKINLDIQIPFGEIPSKMEITGSTLAEYIKSVYAFGSALLVAITIIFIMYGGILWLMSGGNPGRVTKAKGTIINAMIGLMIGIMGITILGIFSPGTLNFSPLGVTVVEEVYLLIDEDYFDPITAGIKWELDGGSYGATGNMPVYRQGCDRTTSPAKCPPWASKRYGSTCGASYAKAGCGAAAFSMVISYYGLNKNPYEAGQEILVPNGCRGCTGGTSRNCFDSNSKPKALNSIGFKGKRVPKNQVVTYLQANKPLIATVGPTSPKKKCSFTGARHFIALASSDGTNITVHDPNGKHKSPWVCPKEDVLGSSAPEFFYIAPADKFSPL